MFSQRIQKSSAVLLGVLAFIRASLTPRGPFGLLLEPLAVVEKNHRNLLPELLELAVRAAYFRFASSTPNSKPYIASGSTIRAGGGMGTPVSTRRTQPSDPSASWNPDVSGRSEGFANSVTETPSIAHGGFGIPTL